MVDAQQTQRNRRYAYKKLGAMTAIRDTYMAEKNLLQTLASLFGVRAPLVIVSRVVGR